MQEIHGRAYTMKIEFMVHDFCEISSGDAPMEIISITINNLIGYLVANNIG